MFRFALISLTACAAADVPPTHVHEDDLQQDKIVDLQPEIPILSHATLYLLDQYPERLIVTLPPSDFLTAQDPDSDDYADLMECSAHLRSASPEEEFVIMLLDSTEDKMVEEAEHYLDCPDLQCYSIDISYQNEGAPPKSAAYTHDILNLEHDFASGCMQFVDAFLEERETGDIEYFHPGENIPMDMDMDMNMGDETAPPSVDDV
eukprot:GEMP01029144.1.p1 GENE.GEMP01029144.1~~GEMP01029144.1.p1  ORF type:complete len:205 (+),score=49.03 GEMP01029144.1:168-782(+)